MKLHNLNTKQYFKSRNLCLCIGNFDGIHLGHQHVIKKIINNAQSDNLKSAIMTFVPHPKIYFKKNDSNFNIITNNYKKNFLNSLGVENYIEYNNAIDKTTSFRGCMQDREGDPLNQVFNDSCTGYNCDSDYVDINEWRDKDQLFIEE